MEKQKKQSPLSASMEAYERLKREQETAEQRIQQYERDLRKITGFIMSYNVFLEEAETDDEREEYESGIKEFIEEVKELNKNITYLRDTLPQAMNAIIEEVSQNPDVQRMMNSRMDSEYRRKIEAISEKRKELAEKKEKATLIQNYINQDPDLKECMKNLIQARKELPALQKMLEIENRLIENGNDSSENSERRAKIEEKIRQTHQIIATNKEKIAISVGRVGVPFDVAVMICEGATVLSNGNIDFEGQYDKRIQKYDRVIMYYNVARQNLNNNNVQIQTQQQAQPQQQVQPQAQPQQQVQQQSHQAAQPQPQAQPQQQVQPQQAQSQQSQQTAQHLTSHTSSWSNYLDNHPTETIHWWNFIKRFRRWRAERQALRDGTAFEEMRAQAIANTQNRQESVSTEPNPVIIPENIQTQQPDIERQVIPNQQQENHDSANNTAANPLYSTPENNGDEYAFMDRATILSEDIFKRELISDIYDMKKSENESATKDNIRRIDRLNEQLGELDEPDFTSNQPEEHNTENRLNQMFHEYNSVRNAVSENDEQPSSINSSQGWQPVPQMRVSGEDGKRKEDKDEPEL